MDDPEMVDVAHYSTAIHARMALIVLEDAGIPVTLLEEHTVSWVPAYDIFAPVRLQVPRKDLERAIAILDGCRPGWSVDDPPTDRDPDDFLCLTCRSKIPESSACCPSCGWTWEGTAST